MTNKIEAAPGAATSSQAVLIIDNDAGLWSKVFPTKDEAKQHLADYVRQWWTREIPTEAIPDDQEEAVDRYFELVEERALIEEHALPASGPLRDLAQQMVTMLRDLHSNWPWRELNHSFDEIRERAVGLGLTVED